MVGVGASAGGLEAFTVFLKHLHPNSGMAFVLIQHLDEHQQSQLTDLLSKATAMPVVEVSSNTPIEPDHVYVIAPGVRLSISDGVLIVEPRESGRNLPIDYFLKSLAQDRGSKAIGIVLSGTASDGTLGLKAVKAEGGITFAQEPSSAKFDGMPRSAVAAGVVDFVLRPREIAKRLLRLAQHPYVALRSGEESRALPEMDSSVSKIFQLLQATTGKDFTYYKGSTLRRRIHRRMLLRGHEKLSDYVEYLQENPIEVRALAGDLLISVTSFFREPDALETLAAKVFPELLKNRSPDDAIRIWVPGCATGEEAYSIAICLIEFLEGSGVKMPVQIFASDVNENAVEKARVGLYGMAALTEVSAERLKRFFVKTNGAYQIGKSIREMCVFAQHNIVKDPPFHNLDLISCCNVLIYFGPVLQRKSLAVFYYALKPGGFLMLGPSESVSPLSKAFSPVDKKLYAKQPGPSPASIPTLVRYPVDANIPGANELDRGIRVGSDIQKLAERTLLADYAPPTVIVDSAMNIVHVRGDAGRFLQLPPGEPTYNLLRMARDGLVVALRTVVLKAMQRKSPAVQQALLKMDGQFREVNLRVVPMNGPDRAAPPFLLVVFEETGPTASSAPAKGAGKAPADAKPTRATARNNREIVRLKQELLATRDYLQSIIEEQEASTEELKSASEEAQASNEELETAKEELQSANEELNTLNDELKTRNAALSEANGDLSNVLTSLNIPVVMVGKDLHIRRFTPSMEPMLNLIDSDVGRLISDLKPNIDIPDLPDLLRKATAGGEPVVREVQDPKGRWLALQVLPYKTQDSKVDGALLAMVDIDAVKHARDFAEAIVETVRHPLIVLDKNLRVQSANEAFYEIFKVSKEETVNRFIYELGNGQWNILELRKALENVLPNKGVVDEFEVTHTFERIGRRTIVLSARELRHLPPYGETKILLVVEDITGGKRAEERLRRSNEDLRHFAYAASHDLQEPLRMVASYTQLFAKQYAGKIDKEADQFIAYAVEGVQRIDALLKGMREYWQAFGHTEELRIDVNEVMKKVLFNLKEPIKRAGAAVTCDSLPTVWADEVPLVQVLQNLVGNAIKYRSEEPPKVQVSVQKNSENEWLFSVRDNGIGIDPQDARKIFDPFTRLERRKHPGSGMGLAICRKIVERLQGRIWVESEPGRGADFKFTIPSKE